MKSQIRQILKKLKLLKLECLIVTSEANISYLCGISSRESYLIVSKNKLYYLTDSRYTEEAKKQLSREFAVVKITGPVFPLIFKILKRIKAQNAGFEENQITCFAYNKLKNELKDIHGIFAYKNAVNNRTRHS